jgi:hypothetical protein
MTQEVINDINAPLDLSARIAARLEQTVNDLLNRERERCVVI